MGTDINIKISIEFLKGGKCMVSAVIVAGGKGKRMGRDINKQYIKIGEREILSITIESFEKCSCIDEIVVVTGEDEIEYCIKNIVSKYGFKKVSNVVKGGRERQESVYNGLLACNNTDIVLIHDGARPFIEQDIIFKSVKCAGEYGACAAAVPVKDTIKVVSKDMEITGTPDRKTLYAVQTPQTFKYDIILGAHEAAKEKGLLATDDTALVENQGHIVKVITGSYSNIKITTPEDLIFAEEYIKNIVKEA